MLQSLHCSHKVDTRVWFIPVYSRASYPTQHSRYPGMTQTTSSASRLPQSYNTHSRIPCSRPEALDREPVAESNHLAGRRVFPGLARLLHAFVVVQRDVACQPDPRHRKLHRPHLQIRPPSQTCRSVKNKKQDSAAGEDFAAGDRPKLPRAC